MDEMKFQTKIESKETPKIKEGVDFVFEQNPELEQIGTKEQYSEYLDTIFPGSKVKEIIYHSSSTNIEDFRKSMFGTYFSYSPLKYSYGGVVHCVLVDIKNPLVMPRSTDSNEVKLNYDKEYRAYNNPTFTEEGFSVYKYDANIQSSLVDSEGVQITVRSPEQIHILASKQDLENFKNFVANK